MPIETTAPMIPSALPRSAGGKASVTIAVPKAIVIAAPMACSTRKPISQPTVGASPQSSEPMVKTTNPLV